MVEACCDFRGWFGANFRQGSISFWPRSVQFCSFYPLQATTIAKETSNRSPESWTSCRASQGESSPTGWKKLVSHSKWSKPSTRSLRSLKVKLSLPVHFREKDLRISHKSLFPASWKNSSFFNLSSFKMANYLFIDFEWSYSVSSSRNLT